MELLLTVPTFLRSRGELCNLDSVSESGVMITPCNRKSIRFKLIAVGSETELETPVFDNLAMIAGLVLYESQRELQ